MFDFDAGKLLIIGVIALIVIGPKELPRVLRQVGQFVGRMRRIATEFQGQFMDAMKEADIQSIRDEVEKLNKESALNVNFDPARDLQSELTRSVDRASSSLSSSSVEPAAAIEASPALTMPTDSFAIPQGEGAVALLDAAEAEPESGTLAAAGLAPVAEDPSSIDVSPQAAAEPLQPARKRKILLLKRRPVRMKAHDVWDRTAARRGRTAGASR